MSFYTPLEFRNAMFTAFAEVWDDLCPVAYPNVEFKPQGLDRWARIVIDGNGEPQERWSGSTNPALFTQTGDVLIQCFIRQGQDTDGVYELVERAQAFVQRHRVPGVIWERGRAPEEIGDDGPWWQVAVRSGWRYFQTRAD